MKYHLRYWWLVLCRWVGIAAHPWDRWRRHTYPIDEIVAGFERDPEMRAQLAAARMTIRNRIDLLAALRATDMTSGGAP
jgi:hypothetical protein